MKNIVPVEISRTRIADMLVGAFEGGSNYWAGINWDESIEPEKIDFDQFKDDREFCGYDKECYSHVHWPMSSGGRLYIYDCGSYEDEFLGWLDNAAIEKGLKLIAEKSPSHFGDILSGNDDASTADVFIQYCVLGDIVYG